MDYFKVIIDNNVVDVGTFFMKWNEKRHKMYLSTLNEAQFVQGRDGNTIYRDDWLKPYQGTPSPYTPATVVIIGAREYDELRALLEDGEDIPVLPDPEPEPDPVIPDDPTPEPESEMTISEMRQQIIFMSEMMEMLTECILEMSEVVYDG